MRFTFNILMQLPIIIVSSALVLSMFVIGCRKTPNNVKRRALLDIHVKFLDGKNARCAHPQYANQPSVCYVEYGEDCRAIFSVSFKTVTKVEDSCSK